MKFYVGLTDCNWFEYLRRLKPDEVNFWRPGGKQGFQAIEVGAPFLFKLHQPYHAIAGGGYFVRFTRLPLSVAWLTFGPKNGAPERRVFFEHILKYRRARGDHLHDPLIGNIILTQPFFLEERDWLPVPSDWASGIQQGKTYDTHEPQGAALWAEVEARLRFKPDMDVLPPDREPHGFYTWTFRRLGQGAFRALVTDAYRRQCAVTGEHTLPVLEAAHIQPYSQGGPHAVQNGLLLRSDLHILFDQGYVSVDEDFRFLVSEQLHEDYHNGKDYYARHKKPILLPEQSAEHPAREFLVWHRMNVYLG